MNQAKPTKFLLITANIGSIFEEHNGLLTSWLSEFLKTIQTIQPAFIALHCQEVGGKRYEHTMQYVGHFVKTLVNSCQLIDFHRQIFLDEDYSLDDKFTALGNLYFIHKSQSALIWNFENKIFVPVVENQIHTGNIEHVCTKEKLKYPQDFFPQCKWSRKGFMRTRWLIDNFSFDLVNLHLFHDESNLVAISKFPTAYTKNRRRALSYTLDLIKTDDNLPVFIFGDFNFRLDTQEVVKKLTNNVSPSTRHSLDGEVQRLVYHDNSANRVLTLERKKFLFSDKSFYKNPSAFVKLQPFDKELDYFKEKIIEPIIDFPPSYPFEEKMRDSGCSRYMKTRCPAWCDRILMDRQTLGALTSIEYQLMGKDVAMGDHKPVYLAFQLATNKTDTEDSGPSMAVKMIALKPSQNSEKEASAMLSQAVASIE